jgi:hypothetical protein
MVLSVPYALKAGDAETLGGLPASAFMQASSENPQSANSSVATSTVPGSTASQENFLRLPVLFSPVTGTGTTNNVPVWTSASTLGNSSIHQSGSNVQIGTTVLEGDGISPINVKAFGARGDGRTDDTAAIAAAIAAIPATGGELFFPAGKYITSGGFVLASPTDVVGVGETSRDLTQYGSEIVSTSPTAVLFTVTAKVGKFRNVGLVSVASAPTAGAAIFTNSTDPLQMINIDGISVAGFYDDVHVGVGSSWSMRASHIRNPVRYGLYIQNTVYDDDGDWAVTDNYFEGGPNTSTTISAGINIESSGGGKIANNKINATYYSGIRMNVSNSAQTLIDNNDIENIIGSPINIVHGWSYITIIGNYLNGLGTSPCISIHNMSAFYIGDNLLETTSSTPVPFAAIQVISSSYGTIGPNVYNTHFLAPTSITGSEGIVDMSSSSLPNLALSGPETITEFASGTLAGLTIVNTNGMGGAGINLEDVYGGVTYTGSIASSSYGSGMTFTTARDLAGSGFNFNSNSGTTRFFIDTSAGTVKTTNNTLDDGKGNMNIPAGKAYQVNGTSIVPLAGTTGTIGGATLTAGTCATGTVTITGATTSMVATASPVTHPGPAFQWNAYVSAANTATVSVCTSVAGGGTPIASAYNVRVVR